MFGNVAEVSTKKRRFGDPRKRRGSADERTPDAIRVYTEMNPDGSASYIVTISVGEDVALSLKADATMRYVAAVHRAAVLAQHDAAVMAQHSGRLKLSTEEAAHTIATLREDREPVQADATAPLRFEPIIAARNLAPYVQVWAGDKPITQWTPQDCIQHAGQVLTVLAGVDLDSAYYRYLTHTIGVDSSTAKKAVYDLGNYDTGTSWMAK